MGGVEKTHEGLWVVQYVHYLHQATLAAGRHVDRSLLLFCLAKNAGVLLKSTVLQRAIRSGASDESRATWKAWLEAALKVVAYQQQVLGRAQSVAGVSASPPPGVLTLASRPMAGEDAENRSPIGQDVKRTANTAIHDTSTLDKEQDAGVWSVVVSVAHSVRAVSFDAIASSRITLGLTFLCLLVIVIQQISIWRLARQVENLTLAVNHLQKRLG